MKHLKSGLFAAALVLGLFSAPAFAQNSAAGDWDRAASAFDDAVGWVWTLLKALLVAVVIIWFRVSWPRLREDQLQRLAWVWLVPLALVQLALTGAGVVVFQ